ncbi:hypothetical protein GOP47_0019407 [Adiantum capillus-veneris]|uniref:Beta-fructofuranosidase n=1 Tax=Adiantum capillus-veneris TaxID=13818 RepID=A0A9D4UBF3_ADICA|nr:hypothetical protein GOP47_0019407 [Adiantum capillus-veneris]
MAGQGAGHALKQSFQQPLIGFPQIREDDKHGLQASGLHGCRVLVHHVLLAPMLLALLCSAAILMATVLNQGLWHSPFVVKSYEQGSLQSSYTPKSKEASEAELWPREDSPWNASAFASLRTNFHFQPPNNWMNDPDAPLYYNGWYHLFYQYNPSEAYWGLISWGHAVSKDLIHWLYVQPLAMVPDHWYDENGVWTGSATMLPRENNSVIPAIMYTGSTNESVQVQNVVFPKNSSDDLLVEWTKIAENPVVTPPTFVNVTDFRDPTTAWRGKNGLWTIAIGSHFRPTHTGMALLYQSMDFVSWELLPDKFLHSVDGSGMWECVDFYPIVASGEWTGLDTSSVMSKEGGEVKHVLKASMDDSKLDFYSIGKYDAESFTFTPDDTDLDLTRGYRYDYGRFYASKTFYDPLLQRRILFGWINESDTRQDDVNKGWSGVQSMPRQVWFDNITKDSLIQWPIEEIRSLYKRNISFTDVTLESGTRIKIEGAKGAQWDIVLSFAKPSVECILQENYTFGPFGVYVLSSEDLQEYTGVYFYLIMESIYNKSTSYLSQKTFIINDLTRSSLASHVDNGTHGALVTIKEEEDELTLRIIVDHSIIETFAQGGRTVITSRVYPTIALDASANLYLFNDAHQEVIVRQFEAYEISNTNMHYINPLTR